ncbi:MAG: hypothetical protein ABI972_12005 [Acidobacteriota bacterium]
MQETAEGESRRIWICAAVVTVVGWALLTAYAIHAYLYRTPEWHKSPSGDSPVRASRLWVTFRGARVQAALRQQELQLDHRARPSDGIELGNIHSGYIAFLSTGFNVTQPSAREFVVWGKERVPIVGTMRRISGWEDVDVWICVHEAWAE